MGDFVFGSRSVRNLQSVHPDLVRVAHRALALSDVDFAVTEGLRTVERQRELYAQGKSKTLRSRHLSGLAIDVVAYVNGGVNWNIDPFYFQIAEAFAGAARELQVPVVWGACWETLNDTIDLRAATRRYVERESRAGRRPLVDGVHFELDREAYPDG